ncbi:methylated-DNA--protein-cysteine methyltransferase [Microbacterium sorbitolivorans]|uniref:methylated-DNA--[protein]-cysteine S-methyltransferase n=1 Tax=Microbacterium sorbitolivorans TaxID=1867410 RepID=A0A367Y1Y6_9MICO|nr:methylated-DNA--[protein]-cysteine S-methyltransferase [Microbacterium sorbitolivorans]RCK59895.1 methylated-DNA--[protein]-cysteine S-methyltransferase [Microbacterium sorbitolivorans]GGF40975.1 methylated-DNA--protein-cysteine methyltransferase [Microbacterium sorbitolivorans]
MPRSGYLYTVTATPFGAAVAVFTPADALVALGTAEDPLWVVDAVAREIRGSLAPADGDVAGLGSQLGEYFDGSRTAFDVEIDWALTDGFARDALQCVTEIPYGETASYGEVAEMAGRPRAHRAVGTACRFTPLTLVVPVHRVIRADGSAGEFSGREDVKRFLLELEGATFK